MSDFKYLRVEDFFRNAKVTTIAEDVRKEIQKENDRPIPFCETEAGKQGEIYSLLGNKVVGAEGEF